MTERECRVWNHHLDSLWNQPDRTDHYLMALRLEVRRGYSKEARKETSLTNYRLPFEVRSSSDSNEEHNGMNTSKLTLKQQCEISKMKMGSVFGVDAKTALGKKAPPPSPTHGNPPKPHVADKSNLPPALRKFMEKRRKAAAPDPTSSPPADTPGDGPTE
jgi:hypothetical protein